jgi:acetyl-CoA carboxylase biotin carboxyl carrier protein
LLTCEQIKELIELVSRHRLEGLEIERSGFRLKIDGHDQARASAPAAAAAAPPAAPVEPVTEASPAAAAPEGGGQAASAAPPAGAHVLTSPIVGTFYASPSPDAEPYVRQGDRVRKGQVLCIVEAMKLMNEIESDADGVIAAIYPQNAQPVEFGDPLFAIQPE